MLGGPIATLRTHSKKPSEYEYCNKTRLSHRANLKNPLQNLSKLKENLTLLTEATAGLKTLDFFIGEKDYQSLRLAMRKPPVVYLRSSARKVITNLDDESVAKKVRRGEWRLFSIMYSEMRFPLLKRLTLAPFRGVFERCLLVENAAINNSS